MLAVIIPVFNEQEILAKTLSILQKDLAGLKHTIVFVDDGSSDNSWQLISGFAKKYAQVKAIRLSRNFGHQSAYTAGLSAITANHYCMLDCDLQDPPELIPKMLKKLEQTQSGVVYGKRTGRKEFFLKRGLFNLFHYIFSKVCNTQFPRNVGNFSVMTKEVRDAMLMYHERNRYLPGLRFFAGFEQIPFVYKRNVRIGGEPKMSMSKLFKLGIDALFSFTDFPIKFFSYVGFAGIFASVVLGVKVLLDKLLFNTAILGWASVIFIIVFFASLQLMLLSVLGKYIYNIYDEVRQRPLFIISEKVE